MSGRRHPDPTTLSDRQKVFVDEYLIDLNIAAAARRAGYAKSTAHAPDKLITPAVRAAIDEKLRERALRAEVAGQAIVAELAKLAFSNILDYVTVGEGGVPAFDFAALTRDQGAAIQTLTIDYWREPIVRKRDRKPESEQGGEPSAWRPTPRRIRVTLADKRAALTELQRYVTVFNALTEAEKLQIPRLVRYVSGMTHAEDPDGERGQIIWQHRQGGVPDELVRRVNELDGFGPLPNPHWRLERAFRARQSSEARAARDQAEAGGEEG